MEERRAKRKSPCQNFIFELNDNEMSSEETECAEPEPKLFKSDEKSGENNKPDSNLETTQQSSNLLEIKEILEDKVEDCIENQAPVVTDLPENSDLNETGASVEILENCNASVDIEDGEVKEPQISDEVDRPNPEMDQPCICITFSDETIAALYKTKFVKFIQTFVELEIQSHDNVSIKINRDSILNPAEWVVMDETIDLKEFTTTNVPTIGNEIVATPKKRKKKSKPKEKELFVLDTNPSLSSKSLNTKYSPKFSLDLGKNGDEEQQISTQSCFNCDKYHFLKDCPEPLDYQRINAARQRFKSHVKPPRYHLEEEQKYSNCKPGQISENLREALGLRKNQLPPFIYHMRMLGYPPGWLEEAKFVHSNLAMFDIDGKNLKEVSAQKPGLDPEKIVDYPGFNVPLEKGMKDEHRQHHTPPYSEQFSKQAMMEFFEKQFSKEQDDLETCDMDLDNTNGDCEEVTKLAEANVEIKEIKPKVVLAEEPVRDSPSLIDLEKQKLELLAALNDNSSNSNQTKPEDSSSDKLDDIKTLDESSQSSTIIEPSSNLDKEIKVTVINDVKVPVEENLVLDLDKTLDSSVCFASPSLNLSLNSVKNSSFGTPVLKSGSPFSRLPNPDNFSKDVSPVINFENLPNSTGKYEQMSNVLQKVRNTLKNLQNCNS